jgi:hypothetical protein
MQLFDPSEDVLGDRNIMSLQSIVTVRGFCFVMAVSPRGARMEMICCTIASLVN